jgi:hypothetical protein
MDQSMDDNRAAQQSNNSGDANPVSPISGSGFSRKTTAVANIRCDKARYVLPTGHHTGANLRAFLAVPDGKDLYYETEFGDDTLIEQDKHYFIENGDRLYTVSREINEG